MNYLMVGIGGGLGALARVILSNLLPASWFGIPQPILLINILGCLLIGLLSETMALYGTTPDSFRYFLIPGFLGGFTTFSSFALEFGYLVERNQIVEAAVYVIASVSLSILCFFMGLKIVRLF